MSELKELKEILLDLRGRKLYYGTSKEARIELVNADLDKALALVDSCLEREQKNGN